MLKSFVVSFALVASTAPALAAAPKAEPVPARKSIVYKEADTATGSPLGPSVSVVSAQKPVRGSSLIDVRADFVPELLRSADDI